MTLFIIVFSKSVSQSHYEKLLICFNRPLTAPCDDDDDDDEEEEEEEEEEGEGEEYNKQ